MKTDKSISQVVDLQMYLLRGRTIEEISDQIIKFNASENNPRTAELHTVADCDIELARMLLTEADFLFAPDIIHRCDEPIPVNTYVYVFEKHPGHDYPALEGHIMKALSADAELPCINTGRNSLPVFWCRAKDLLDHLGITKHEINKEFKRAKAMACGWYKEEE